jgi:hypothetical protein
MATEGAREIYEGERFNVGRVLGASKQGLIWGPLAALGGAVYQAYRAYRTPGEWLPFGNDSEVRDIARARQGEIPRNTALVMGGHGGGGRIGTAGGLVNVLTLEPVIGDSRCQNVIISQCQAGRATESLMSLAGRTGKTITAFTGRPRTSASPDIPFPPSVNDSGIPLTPSIFTPDTIYAPSAPQSAVATAAAAVAGDVAVVNANR